MPASFVFSAPTITKENLRVYDARKSPLSLHGLYKPEEAGNFKRLPEDVALSLGDPIKDLYTNTAGARLRFATDSDVIAVGVGEYSQTALS